MSYFLNSINATKSTSFDVSLMVLLHCYQNKLAKGNYCLTLQPRKVFSSVYRGE